MVTRVYVLLAVAIVMAGVQLCTAVPDNLPWNLAPEELCVKYICPYWNVPSCRKYCSNSQIDGWHRRKRGVEPED